MSGNHDISLIVSNEWCADTFSKYGHPVDIGRDDFELSLSIDTADVYIGEVIELKAESNQSFKVLSWHPVELFLDQNAYDQHFTTFETQTYSIRAISADDCVDTANLEVRVHPINTDIFMPNAFSPNGDGLNDEFGPELLIHRGYVISDFSIYNRVGQVVFHNRGSYNKKWDGTFNGKDCAVDTYFYYLKVRFQDGTNKDIKGEVTLVR